MTLMYITALYFAFFFNEKHHIAPHIDALNIDLMTKKIVKIVFLAKDSPQ